MFWLQHSRGNEFHKLTKNTVKSVQSELWWTRSWSRLCRPLQSTRDRPEQCLGWGWSKKTDQDLCADCCCVDCCSAVVVVVAVVENSGGWDSEPRTCQRCRRIWVNSSRPSEPDHWRSAEHSCCLRVHLRSSSSWTDQHSPPDWPGQIRD